MLYPVPTVLRTHILVRCTPLLHHRGRHTQYRYHVARRTSRRNSNFARTALISTPTFIISLFLVARRYSYFCHFGLRLSAFVSYLYYFVIVIRLRSQLRTAVLFFYVYQLSRFHLHMTYLCAYRYALRTHD